MCSNPGHQHTKPIKGVPKKDQIKGMCATCYENSWSLKGKYSEDYNQVTLGKGGLSATGLKKATQAHRDMLQPYTTNRKGEQVPNREFIHEYGKDKMKKFDQAAAKEYTDQVRAKTPLIDQAKARQSGRSK